MKDQSVLAIPQVIQEPDGELSVGLGDDWEREDKRKPSASDQGLLFFGELQPREEVCRKIGGELLVCQRGVAG